MKNLSKIGFVALSVFLLSACSNIKETAWKMKNLTNDGNSVAQLEKRNRSEVKNLNAMQSINEMELITASTGSSIVLPTAKPYAKIENNNKVNEEIASTIVITNNVKAKQLKAKTQKPASSHGTGKSQLVALILAIVIGGLGIHRFYLGYTGIGIIQLLTAGGCGIWALIDIVRIAMGDLKPKDGDYTEKL